MFWRRKRSQQDFAAELQAHLALEADRLRESDMSEEEALAAARRNLGNATRIQERFYESHRWLWLDGLIQDLRFGLRQLRRSPGFTAVAVITLALGIGANTAIFSLIDAVMLRSMPVRNPSQLVLFRWEARHSPQISDSSSFGDCSGADSTASSSGCSFSAPFFEMMRTQSKLFSGVTAFAGPAQLDLIGNGPPSTASGELVSGSYFSTLGVQPAIGRVISPEDDTPQASPALVLSYAYWQSAFGGSRSVVGRTVALNNVPFTIVGVASPTFTSLSPGKTQDFWLPLDIAPRLGIRWVRKDSQSIGNWWLVVLARLEPGIARAQAQAAASLIFRNQVLHAAGKPMFKAQDDPAIKLVPAERGLAGLRSYFSQPLYVLMFAVGIILLIACANVAGLLLARGTARHKEMAVRLAVGAGRGRIVRQLLTESVLLSAGGGLVGVVFAFWGVHALTALLWGHLGHPIGFIVTPDWRVFAFTISLSLVTGIIFGLAPAFRTTRLDLTPALKENAPAAPASTSQLRRRFHLGDGLVVAQVALSVVLLAGAGLLVRTLVNLRDTNPGFDTQNVLTFGIDPTSLGYKDAQIRNLYQELRARLAALPGVTSAGYSSDALLVGDQSSTGAYIEGRTAGSEVDVVSSGPGFFRTLRLPLLEGRTFTAADFEEADRAAAAEKAVEKTKDSSSPLNGTQELAGPPTPVLVNRTFVRKFFAGQNPLGKRFGHEKSKPPAWEIVGVVGDAKIIDLRHPIDPTVYLPLTGGSACFELRVAGDPVALIPAVRKLASQVATRLPIFDVHTQTQKIDDLLAPERFIARVSGFFAVLALLLACLGLYGLLSYEANRRTHEIGIRMALGARKVDVLRLMLGEGFRLAVVGLALGLTGAFALTRFLSSLLYGVEAADQVTFAVVALALAAVALVACYIPARRAANVDPMVALRQE